MGNGWYSFRRKKSNRLGPSFSNTCARPAGGRQRTAAGKRAPLGRGSERGRTATATAVVPRHAMLRRRCREWGRGGARRGGPHHADMPSIVKPLLELDAVPGGRRVVAFQRVEHFQLQGSGAGHALVTRWPPRQLPHAPAAAWGPSRRRAAAAAPPPPSAPRSWLHAGICPRCARSSLPRSPWCCGPSIPARGRMCLQPPAPRARLLARAGARGLARRAPCMLPLPPLPALPPPPAGHPPSPNLLRILSAMRQGRGGGGVGQAGGAARGRRQPTFGADGRECQTMRPRPVTGTGAANSQRELRFSPSSY